MGGLFDELSGPTGDDLSDPIARARKSLGRDLPKRFYKQAGVTETATGHQVVLDGKPVRTPGRNPLVAPTLALAEAIAAEWAAQEALIDPARMPLTRLANSVIDGVASEADAVAAEIAAYAATDFLLYRADEPARLVERQTRMWDPLVREAEHILGVRFRLAGGVMHVDQDPAVSAAMRAALPADPWRLAAIHTMTTLTGSAILAQLVAAGRLDVEDAWTAAHLDEDWNRELWGLDAEAAARRVARRAEMDAAARLMALSAKV